jgi:GWxTD domain-containing protein
MVVLLAAACGRTGRTPPPPGTVQGPGVARGTTGLSFDATPLYRQMGLIARGLPFPVLGRTAFLASTSAETTHVVVSFAFASATLAFAREADDRFRADYSVSLALRQGPDVIARSDAEEQVVVSSYRETTRTEETILFQEILDVPPGECSLSVSLRDARSQRTVEERLEIRVPRFADQGISSPVPIAEAVPRSARAALPNLLVSPSGTAIAGRDTIIPLYVESYRASDAPLHLVISNERGRVLWEDTIAVVRRDGLRAGIVEIPVRRIGVGAARVTFVSEGGTDSSSAYVFVGFGSELPVATYEEMLSYLRYFAAGSRIERLRTAAEEERPAAWAEFVAATDSDPTTPEHEELRNYFGRLMRANTRFREEATPGWLTDRGKVFIAIGDPDQIYEPPLNDMQRGRQQMWEYRALNLQLVFYDQTGAGRWRLTQASEVRFETEFRRRLK